MARRRKLAHFEPHIRPTDRVLDFGCADGWFGRWARERGITDVVGLDVVPPADVVGDVRDWRSLGLEPHSFDVIVAFEVLEHGDYATEMHELIKPDGKLLATSPVPRWDWACKLMERGGLLQMRTSDHSHLVDLRRYPKFVCADHLVRGVVAQWAVLRPE